MDILESAADQVLEVWRAQLRLYDGKCVDHIRDVNPHFRPNLRKWVHPDTWMEISENKRTRP